MSIPQLTDLCQLKHEYSSFQLKRFLLNTNLNPGTRLQPTNVDAMVQVIPEPLIGDTVDPFISEVPGFIKTISWSVKEDGRFNSDLVQNPDLCFIEIYSLDPNRIPHPDRNYWERYFKLDKNSTVAPNGILFQSSDKNQNEQISIQLQDERSSLLFGYGLIFTVEVGKEGDTFFCRKDPVANIRSSDAQSKHHS